MRGNDLFKINKFVGQKKEDLVAKWFYIIMVTGLLCSLLSIYYSHGESLNTILFSNPKQLSSNDVFMDFFNSLSDSINHNPYTELGRIYPPLTTIFYLSIAKMLPIDLVIAGGKAIRADQLGMLLFGLYTSITAVILSLLIYNHKKGMIIEKCLFLMVILFSTPFIYQIERANIILLALLFTICFVWLNNSPNKYLREFSLICLAVSAAIKIYPAIFGLLLLKEKRWNDAIRCVIYGIAFFFLPFILWGGLSKFNQMIINIFRVSYVFNLDGYGFKVNISNFIQMLFAIGGEYRSHTHLIAQCTTLVILAYSMFAVFFLKHWKSICLLSLLCIAIPGFSFTYTLVFMVIPLILFLDDTAERKFIDWIYMFLFIEMFIPLTYGSPSFFPQLNSCYPVSLSVFIESLSVFVMIVLLMIEGLLASHRYYKQRSAKCNLNGKKAQGVITR